MNKFFSNLRKYHKYAVRSAKAELKSEVADSYLSWLWWIIEPMSFMIIYTFVFGYVFKNPDPHFASFIMIGLSFWDFFNRMITGSVKLIINNRDLVTKVYLPKYVLLYSKSLTYLFKMFISLCLSFVLMAVQHVYIDYHILFLIPVIIVLYILTFGIGMILMHYGVTFNDLSNLMNIILKMVFYLSGVFYNLRIRLGGSIGYILLRANPIAFLMDEARKCTVEASMVSIEGLSVWLLSGIVLCIIGVHVIHKYENSYAKVI